LSRIINVKNALPKHPVTNTVVMFWSYSPGEQTTFETLRGSVLLLKPRNLLRRRSG